MLKIALHRLRNWNPINNDVLVLIVILLVGFGLRIWGVNFGLPRLFIIDEGETVYTAFYAASHKLRPLWYLHTPFLAYILIFEYALLYVGGALSGMFRAPLDLFYLYVKDPTLFFLLARITVALSGTLTVFMTWKIGREFFGKMTGNLAALFLAVNFLHVKESHYAKDDVLAGLMVAISFYFTGKIVTQGKAKNFVGAGLFLGFAVGAKYPAVLFSVVLLVALILSPSQKKIQHFALTCLWASLAFFVVNPYMFLAWSSSFKGLYSDFVTHALIENQYSQTQVLWKRFLVEHIPQGTGILIYVCGLGGFLYGLIKGKEQKMLYLMPVLPAVFILTVDRWVNYSNARYAIMTLPMFALAAAIFVSKLNSVLPQARRWFVICITVAALIYQPLKRSIAFNHFMLRPDTRIQAKTWIEANVVPGTSVYVSSLKPEYPSGLSAPLNLTLAAIDKRITDAGKLGITPWYLNALKAAAGDKGYNLITSPRIDMDYNVVTNRVTYLTNAKPYYDGGVEYLVLSNWAFVESDHPQFDYASIAKYYDAVQEFTPRPQLKWEPHFIYMDYTGLDSINVFDPALVFGPHVTIYRRKPST